MYEITFDHVARRLELRLRGFWTDETMDEFARDLRPYVAAAKARYASFDLLSDASDFPVQATAMVPRFGDLMSSLEIYKYGKTAVIVGTVLNKMQAERAEGRSHAKIFLDRSAAVQWLSDRE